jgi:hypothetical protein
MSVHLAHDIWNELRQYLSTPDRAEAADSLVAVLIDNDHNAEDIRTTFKGDNDIKQALQSYIDDAEEDLQEDFDDDFDNDSDDNYR